jgi:ABC-type uncharacterized transport system permease subunit
VFQITIFIIYLIAGLAFGASRWPRLSDRENSLVSLAVVFCVAGIAMHAGVLWQEILPAQGLSLSLANAASFIGLQLALTALLGAKETALRGLSGGLLLLAAVTASLTGWQSLASPVAELTWQLRAHVLISLFAYGLLTVGAIVAVYALVQDRRLRTARLSPLNQLFAPLETTEKLLFGITATGFTVLLLAVFSGFVFVENIFAQHLVHKTALSILALLLFGILLLGRHFAGWRGKSAVYLYLWGFVMLGLAYFGSRFILEYILGRSWN